MVMIKGIEIDFDARTTKLDQALRAVSARAKGVQAELRGINTLLKMNPKSVVLAEQKTRMLGRAVKETELKQARLNKALAQADAAGVNKNSAAYRKLQREAELTAIKLRQLKKEQLEWMASQSRIGKMSSAMTAFGAKVSGVADKMKYLSLAAAGVAALSLRVGMNFDEGMSKVAAVTGATGDELDQLRQKAKDLGRTTKFSATEATEAMNYMAMAGWKTEDMLSGLDGVMNLAAASGEDLATTSDIVTDALTAFGLKAADSNHFADVLAAASANANTNVKMMGETFKYAAPIAGSLGYKIEDVAESIGLMGNAGIKSSQAGTSLRRIMTSLNKDFTISGKRLGEVTIKTTKADGSMRKWNDIIEDSRKAFSKLSESEQATAAEALVGKNAMSGFLALMNASPKDIKKLEDALHNADGASKDMAQTMLDNTKGSLTILKSTLESAGIAISETLAPMLTKVVEGIRAMVEKFNDLSPGTKDMIAKFVMITAVGYPVLKLVGGLATGIGTLLKPVSMLVARMGLAGGSLGKFSSLLAAVPLPAKLAIGAVAGLAAAIKIHENRIHGATNAYKEGKKAREEAIAQAMSEASEADYLKERLGELMAVENKSAGQKATIKKIVEQLNEKVSGLNLSYNAEKDALSKTNAEIEKKIANMKKEAETAALQEAMTAAFKQRLDLEKKLTAAEINLSEARRKYNQIASNPHANEEDIQGAAENVRVMAQAYDDAEQAVADCDEEIDDYNRKILRAGGETKGLEKRLYYGSTAFTKLVKKVKETGYTFSHDLVKGFRKGRYQVPRTVNEMKRAIKWDDMLRKAKAAGVKVPKRLSKGVLSGKIPINQACSTVETWIQTGINPDMSGVGSSIIEGIKGGIETALPGIGPFLDSVASDFKKNIMKAFDINSPSKIMFPIGESITEGITVGMGRSAGNINKATKALVSAATNVSVDGYKYMDSGAMTSATFGNNSSVVNNITVNGAENPEDYASRLARTIKLQLRTV